MKLLWKIVTAVLLLNVAIFASADEVCPDTLNADEMYDCIVVEGAGGTYLDERASSSELAEDETSVSEESNENNSTASKKSTQVKL